MRRRKKEKNLQRISLVKGRLIITLKYHQGCRRKVEEQVQEEKEMLEAQRKKHNNELESQGVSAT